MKATIIKAQENGRNYSGEKALHSAYIAVSGTEEPVIVKIWQPWSRNGSTIYASVWVHSKKLGVHTAGHGRAGGGGHHKPSAAVAEAVKRAGIELDTDIDGRGDRAIEDAAAAIAEAAGYPGSHVVKI